MQIDMEPLLKAIHDGMLDGVKSRLSHHYSSPLDDMLKKAISSSGLDDLIATIVKSLVSDEEFKGELKAAARTSLAKLLVQRFGGEMERQVNSLKSNPATRARIAAALADIVGEVAGATT